MIKNVHGNTVDFLGEAIVAGRYPIGGSLPPEPVLCEQLGVRASRCALIGDANSDLRMAQQAGVPVVIGYGAGWSTPPPLDPCFPCLSHWRELEVRTTSA